MNEDFCFKLIGYMPMFSSMLDSVSMFTEADWVSYSERKKRGGAAAEKSDTIPLIYSPNPATPDMVFHELFSTYSCYLDSVLKVAQASIECTSVRQAMFTRLRHGTEIKRHKDKGPITKRSHRIHIPIITNSKCLFTVDNETLHMGAGEIWAIDNVGKFHSVVNNGDIDRVHLIVDLM